MLKQIPVFCLYVALLLGLEGISQEDIRKMKPKLPSFQCLFFPNGMTEQSIPTDGLYMSLLLEVHEILTTATHHFHKVSFRSWGYISGVLKRHKTGFNIFYFNSYSGIRDF